MSLEYITGNILDFAIKKVAGLESETAIVIPANRDPGYAGESNVDYQIYKAAGEELLLSKRIATENDGKLDAGDVIITDGCNLSYKYVIHAVVPRNVNNPEKKLKSCYRAVLEEAYNNGIEYIVFPLLGAGSMKFGEQLSFNIGTSVIMEFISEKKCLAAIEKNTEFIEPKVFLNVYNNNLQTLKDLYQNEYCISHYCHQNNELPKSEALWYIENYIKRNNISATQLAHDASIDPATISRFRELSSDSRSTLKPIIAISLACAMNLKYYDFNRFMIVSTLNNNYMMTTHVYKFINKIKLCWNIQDSDERRKRYALILEEIDNYKISKSIKKKQPK